MSRNEGGAQGIRTFFKFIYGPIIVCWYHKVDAFIWLMFTLVASQLGTIINVINRMVFQGWDFQVALCPESASGTFYTFALVMISSLMSPLFISIVNRKPPTYNRLKMVFATILIFVLILAAVFYAFSSQNIEIVNFASLKNSDVTADWCQLSFFIFTIFASIYAFGLNYLSLHPEFVDLSDDYQEKENEEVESMRGELYLSEDDGKGVVI